MRQYYEAILLFIAGVGIVIFGLTGCGKLEVSGTVEHKVTLDIDTLKKYFTTVCEEKQPGDLCYSADIQQCADCMVGDFLNAIK